MLVIYSYMRETLVHHILIIIIVIMIKFCFKAPKAMKAEIITITPVPRF